MVQRKKRSAGRSGPQVEERGGKDFVDVLKEERENDSKLDAIGSNLATIGRRLADLGKSLDRPESMPPSFELKELESLIAQIPSLISQYHATRAKKIELQSLLTNLSWHRS
jgi:hypothetical protein